jgi:DNA-binding NarL/FixJ family response regulator
MSRRHAHFRPSEAKVPQSELADLIDLIYAAALAEGATWPEVARHIDTLMGAQQASLIVADENGTKRNVFLEPGTYDERLRLYYREISPWRVEAKNGIRDGSAIVGRVVRGEEIVPDAAFLNSEFYNDFGRHAGCRHMIGGLLDAETAATIAFTRDAAAGSFEECDRRTLQTLMPHLQRAYQLRNRLNPDASRLGAGALNALSMAVIVVDGNMHVKHANAAAVALTNGDCGMTVSRTGPEPSLGNTILSARHRDDHSRLSQLVAAVAKGSSGCALRIRNTRDEPASQASLAILVSPAMTHFLSGPEAGCRIQPGTAMIVARHLSHSSLPHPGLMCDLYGLTKAEAAVALSFGGGATAEDVARMRRVSPETVRSQVKAILRKTNTSSLRDLERIIAISSAMLPAAL